MTTSESAAVGSRIRAALAWSSVNSLVLRLGSFAVGILLARLLVPEQFGVFAVALTVQTVLITMADLGMSTDLIRSANHRAKAPTAATLAAVSGISLTALMAASSQGLADLLGSSQAGPVIALLSVSLTLAGLGVVPYAALQRRFAQKKLFLIALVEFLVGTALTIILILAGWGVMALAAGRIASQVLTLILQFALSGEKLRFGFDVKMAPGILRYGVPVAGANMLSWALLNIDNVVISRLAGPVALGYYFLAFNIANWPMSAFGQVVRSISLPAFSRLASGRRDRSLGLVIGTVWPVTLLAGMLLAVLAPPVVEILYGHRWLPAAAALAWLGVFGAVRPLLDLSASYLLARGAATATIIVQVVWIAGLVPAMLVGVHLGGIAGAALGHLVTAAVVVCPVYAICLRRSGADLRLAGSKLWPPLAAAVPAGAAAMLAMSLMPTPLAALFSGAAAGAGVYSLLLARWFMRQAREALAWLPADGASEPLNQPGVDLPAEVAPASPRTASSGGTT